MWQRIVKLLKPIITGEIKKQIVAAILKALGAAGSFWTWIVGFFVGKAAEKIVKEAESAARVEDRENADEVRKEKHDELMKEPISATDPVKQEQEIIQAELDAINGGRRRPKP